ncbi:MFS transporter [Egicoccus halophilus]|uniref:MFS transporter n=1 Tax=Egicoccus halophilus TaxID=1670830 RepID=A0A8J3EV75_9ACTN|nr:MFS transporter [Egicoccus halophilus]GGI07534.1 MFS transporter [Egicoccus halophilus]
MRTLVGVVLLTATLDLVRPLVSYRALELGATVAQIGLIAGSYAVLSFALAIPAGRWIDRRGPSTFIVFGALVLAATIGLLAAAPNLGVLAVAQALLGLGQVFCLIAIQALIANGTTSERRDAHYGMFAFAASIGQVAGPFAAGVLLTSTGSTTLAFLASQVFVLPLLVMAVSLVRRPPPSVSAGRPGAGTGGSLLRSAGVVLRLPSMPQAMSVSIAVMATIDILVAYVPVYGEARGLSAATVGALLAVRAAASGASRLLLMPMLRALGRRNLFLYGLVVPAIALTVLPWSANVALGFALMALAGFGLGLGQPMSLAWVSQAVPPERRGIALGIRLTGNRGGQLLLPVVVGAVGGAAGVPAVFVAMGLMLAGSAGAVLTAEFPEVDPARR